MSILRHLTGARHFTLTVWLALFGVSSPASATLVSLDIVAAPSPFGYFSLASLGNDPFALPANSDDGSVEITGLPAFDYAGATYDSVIWSVNGTLEIGTASGLPAGVLVSDFPDATAPNNLLAPFYADLNLGAGGNWYTGLLSTPEETYIVFEWEEVPLFVDPTVFTFQIWIEAGLTASGHSNIWYTYNTLSFLPLHLAVGVENDTGLIGDSYFFNGNGTPPVVGVDLQVLATFDTGGGDDGGQRIPEPASMALFGFGLLGLGLARRRRKPA